MLQMALDVMREVNLEEMPEAVLPPTYTRSNPMPNATIRANARPMSEDRRAILRSMLAVGAIGATPTAAGTTIAAELRTQSR
jgi:hypothetical protein